MQILLNGAERQVAPGTTIAALLVELRLDPRQLAVERNLELAPRREHEQIELQEGDRLEIVTLVGGG